MSFFTMMKFAAIVCLAAIMFGVAETAAVNFPSSNKVFNRKVGNLGSNVRFPLMHIYSEGSPFRPLNRTWESLISQSIKADASRRHFLKRTSRSFKVDEEEEANVPVQSALKFKTGGTEYESILARRSKACIHL